MEAQSPARLVRWALRLSEFDFEIRHKKGSANANADALSRLVPSTEEPEITDIERYLLVGERGGDLNEFLNNFDISKEQQKDPYLHSIATSILKGEPNFADRFTIKDTTLYLNGPNNKLLLAVPQQIVQNLLEQYHVKSLAHVGRDKMFNILKEKFYWPGMYSDIRRWVKACIQCNKVKPSQPTNHGLLQPIKVSFPFEILGMDILGPLKRSKNGFKYILVFVHQLG